MKQSAVVKSIRPTKELRDQQRRDQIVAAARACVILHGFHAASMAEIAMKARMSVGQIYRYFPSKEAIIHAVVERIVAQRLEWMGSHPDKVDFVDFPAMLARRDPLFHTEDSVGDRALMLEVTAEATRNEAVAKIVREADRRLHEKAVVGMMNAHPSLTQREAMARVELLAVLSEGSGVRHVTEVRAQPQDMEPLYRDLIDRLMLQN